MFQFESLKRAKPGVPAEALDGLAEPQAEAAALLAWAEHCVECAAPACYKTCDLYDPTPLGKCRRFVDGIVPVPRAGKAPLAEVKFKRWGKLEAQGNARPLPVARARTAEKLIRWATIGNRLPAGYLLPPNQAYPVKLGKLLGPAYQIEN